VRTDASRSDLTLWWRGGLPLAEPILRAVFRVKVDGVDNVPRSGPAILAFNHQSVLDGPVLAIVTARDRRRESRFLIASEVFEIPVIGWIVRRYDQIPIRRGEGDASALDEAISTIRRGALAAIAPEGRVNDDPDRGLLRIRTGIARIALPTKAPVVPVGIWGTRERWPKRGPNLRRLAPRPSVGICYGSAILPVGRTQSQGDIDGFTVDVARALAIQVEKARALAGA
jgi:1-acyl-sn-glycerol-3-phosphate acyltransferase